MANDSHNDIDQTNDTEPALPTTTKTGPTHFHSCTDAPSTKKRFVRPLQRFGSTPTLSTDDEDDDYDNITLPANTPTSPVLNHSNSLTTPANHSSNQPTL